MNQIRYLTLVFLIFVMTPLSANVYYVSKAGNNSNTGTKESPFLTIQKAASQTRTGDTCIIEAGTYMEQFKPFFNGSTFKAAPGAKVILSTYEEKNNWTEYQNGIYVTTIISNLNDENQVIYDGQIMNLARWPNKSNFNPFDLEAYKATGTNSSISYSTIPDWNWENGGVLFFLGKNRWTSWRVPITGASAGKVTFNELSSSWDYAGSHSPINGGEFFLSNILEALDKEGEWYIDRPGKKLYFKPPGGGPPDSGKTLVRVNTQAITMASMRDVTIEGLTIHGGKVNMRGSYRCTLQNCEVLYGNHSIASNSSATVSQTSIDLDNNSRENIIRYNNIQWGAGNGVILKGTNNRVENNYIGNFDYLGCYAAPVELRGKNQLLRNEIFNGGRDDIRGGGNGAEVGYNNIHHSNLINDDCGGIYFCCGTFGYTRIHHNWFHDITSRNEHFDKYKGCGVYLDNTSKKVIVDHNVMWNLEWTGIQINWAGEDLLIYNNTIWNKSTTNSKTMGRWVNGYEITNIPVYNTLTNKNEFHSTDLQNSCLFQLSDTPFENFAAKDFRPKNGTCPIDGGIEVPGYTDGFFGAAPDVGAYESGAEPWIAGPTWKSAIVEYDSVKIINSSETVTILPNVTFKAYYQARISGILQMAILNESDEIISESTKQIFAGKGTQVFQLNLDPLPNEGIYKLKLSIIPEDGAESIEDVQIIQLINPVQPVEIEITDTDDRIVLFESRTLTTRVLPEDAFDKSLIWTSSNPDVIKINPTTGEMTAILMGEATITVKTINNIESSFRMVVIPKAGELLPWIENFSLPGDAILDMGPTSWTLETSNERLGSYAAVNLNKLAIRNIECIFKSGTIDLYNVKSVKLELDITGDFKARDSKLDSLLIYYIVDSVEYLAGAYSDRFKQTTVTVDDIRGNKMQVLIKAMTGYTTETYYVDNIRVTENIDASANQIQDLNGFEIYPNPSDGKSIAISSGSMSPKDLSIRDLQGRLIFQTKLSKKNTQLKNLHLSKGIYIVILNKKGYRSSKRLIIR